MPSSSDERFTDQLRQVLKDAVDYAQSVLTLVQARAAEIALSTALGMTLLAAAFGFAIVAFILINIAVAVWLAHVTGGAGWSALILGGFYAVLAVAATAVVVRWLNRLKS